MDDSARFYLPSVDDVHEGWLASLTEQGALPCPVEGQHARRQANGMLLQAFNLPQHRPRELSGVCAWLLLPPGRQRRLAHRLAVAAHANDVRHIIDKDTVAALIEQLSDSGYRRALRAPSLSTRLNDGSTLPAAPLVSALRAGQAQAYLARLGAALLEQTVSQDDSFARIRMRFAFSPDCWRRRPRGLQTESSSLRTQVLEFLSHE